MALSRVKARQIQAEGTVAGIVLGARDRLVSNGQRQARVQVLVVARRDGRIDVQTSAQEADVRQVIGVGFAALEVVELHAQGELDGAVRDEVERCPDALLEETQWQTHDESARLACLDRKPSVCISGKRVILQALGGAPSHRLKEVQEVSKNGHIVNVLGHLASDVEPHVLEHGHGVCHGC